MATRTGSDVVKAQTSQTDEKYHQINRRILKTQRIRHVKPTEGVCVVAVVTPGIRSVEWRPTFTLQGGWLLLLVAAAPPLHPLPAAEHVVVLVRGHFARNLVMREDSCRGRSKVSAGEVKGQRGGGLVQGGATGRTFAQLPQAEEEEKKKRTLVRAAAEKPTFHSSPGPLPVATAPNKPNNEGRKKISNFQTFVQQQAHKREPLSRRNKVKGGTKRVGFETRTERRTERRN